LHAQSCALGYTVRLAETINWVADTTSIHAHPSLLSTWTAFGDALVISHEWCAYTLHLCVVQFQSAVTAPFN